MLKIDRQNRLFSKLSSHSLQEVGLLERQDLQAMIINSPEEFFAEIGENFLLLGQEVVPSSDVADRIDLLGIDRNGSSVIFELKRGSHKFHLLQGVTYAAMISKWDRRQFDDQLARFTKRVSSEAMGMIDGFIDSPIPINQSQRIILLADDFDYEVLVTAEWLTEQYQLDICCYKNIVARDGDAEYLSIVRVFPAPGIREHSIKRGRTGEIRSSQYKNWDEALASVKNDAVKDFMKLEASGNNSNLNKRSIRFKIANQNRFSVLANTGYAYVWQNSRFPGDIDFWDNHLGDGAQVRTVQAQQALSFRLTTKVQFEVFRSCLDGELNGVKFSNGLAGLDDEGYSN